MPLIVINDSKEQMRTNMRERMRHNSRGNGGWVNKGEYRADEAYKDGYEHGWRDCEDEYRR